MEPYSFAINTIRTVPFMAFHFSQQLELHIDYLITHALVYAQMYVCNNSHFACIKHCAYVHAYAYVCKRMYFTTCPRLEQKKIV